MNIIMSPTKFDFYGREKDIEDHIIENIEDIAKYSLWGNIKGCKTQYSVGGKRRVIIDIFLIHEDGSGTVIEVKKHGNGGAFDAIGQLLFYGEFIHEATGFYPRLVYASEKFDHKMLCVIHRYKLPINVLRVDGDECIYQSVNYPTPEMVDCPESPKN